MWPSIFSRKFLLAHGEGRGGKIDDRLRAGLRQHLDGVFVITAALPEVAIVPDVFADADAQAAAVQFQNLRPVGRLEVAIFVEDIVSGQQGLVEGRPRPRHSVNSTALLKSGRPISAGLGVATPTSSGGASFNSAAMRVKRLATALHEAPAHQQIARQITHQGQFGRDHQIGALSLRGRAPREQSVRNCRSISPAVGLI